MRTTSQMIMDSEQSKIEQGNKEYIAQKELEKSNNKNIEEGDTVETSGFGTCVVTKKSYDFITIELVDGSKRNVMNNPKFVWKV